jgi:acetyl esterase
MRRSPLAREQWQGLHADNRHDGLLHGHYIADEGATRLARLAAAARRPVDAAARRSCSPPASTRCATKGAAYAETLTAAGNRASYVCFERQIHGFITMGKVIDEANTAVAFCAPN